MIDVQKPFVPVMQDLVIEPIRDGLILPEYASEGDSGMDLYSPDYYVLEPGETILIKCGFAMEIPKHPFHEYGYRWEAQVRPRSGVSLKTALMIPNSPGTIDNFYVDEVGVIVRNTFSSAFPLPSVGLYDLKGKKTIESLDPRPEGTIVIKTGERFAQIVFNEIVRPLEIKLGIVRKDRNRGGGFGHSGS